MCKERRKYIQFRGEVRQGPVADTNGGKMSVTALTRCLSKVGVRTVCLAVGGADCPKGSGSDIFP